MFPPVYQMLRANATVLAMVGDRIGRHGVIQQDASKPYITWQIVLGQPYDQLSGAPCGDFTTLQLDAYHLTDAGIQQLGVAMQAAADAAGMANRVVINLRDPETKLYRVGLEVDFISQR